MPKIDIKLASGRLPSRRGSGQLSPVLLSSSKGSLSASSGQVNARVSAPRINERSANVEYTPLKPNDILVDKSLDAMGHTAQVFAESAFRFQQRQDRADADALVVEQYVGDIVVVNRLDVFARVLFFIQRRHSNG